MRLRRTLLAAAAGAVLVAGATAGAVAYAGGASDDNGESVNGPGADRARAAALAATGGGTANSVELDSEDGATWEVEVTRPDGGTVDVRLDESLSVVVIEGDTGSSEGD